MGGLTFSIEDWGSVRIGNLSMFFFVQRIIRIYSFYGK